MKRHDDQWGGEISTEERGKKIGLKKIDIVIGDSSSELRRKRNKSVLSTMRHSQSYEEILSVARKHDKKSK
jgi:hypothetical protein